MRRIVIPSYPITVYHVPSQCIKPRLYLWMPHFSLHIVIANYTVSPLDRRCHLFCRRGPITHPLLYMGINDFIYFSISFFYIRNTAISMELIAHVVHEASGTHWRIVESVTNFLIGQQHKPARGVQGRIKAAYQARVQSPRTITHSHYRS